MNTEQQVHENGHAHSGVRKRRLRRYSKAKRQALLAAFDQSTETQKDFCAARDINPGTFKGWLQRRAKRSGPGFAQIEVSLPRRAAIEIVLTNGVRIGIDPQGEQSELISLIRGVAGC